MLKHWVKRNLAFLQPAVSRLNAGEYICTRFYRLYTLTCRLIFDVISHRLGTYLSHSKLIPK